MTPRQPEGRGHHRRVAGHRRRPGRGLPQARLRRRRHLAHHRRPHDADVLAVQGDIADPATADRVIAAAVERFGRVDTLVNNAGIFVAKPFTDYTEATSPP